MHLGYNLRLVSDLHKALKTLYGWTQSSSGTWCGSSGQVLIYNGQLPFSVAPLALLEHII